MRVSYGWHIPQEQHLLTKCWMIFWNRWEITLIERFSLTGHKSSSCVLAFSAEDFFQNDTGKLWHQTPCPELGRNLHTASSPYAAITLDRAEGQEGPLGRLSKRPSPKCSLTKGTRASWARKEGGPQMDKPLTSVPPHEQKGKAGCQVTCFWCQGIYKSFLWSLQKFYFLALKTY